MTAALFPVSTLFAVRRVCSRVSLGRMVSGVDADSADLNRLLAWTTASSDEFGNCPRIYLTVNMTGRVWGEGLTGTVIDILGIDKQYEI